MSDTVIALLSLYFFIFIGFLAKRRFKEDFSDKTLTLLSIYTLQPFLAFWGIMLKPIDTNFVLVPFSYFLAIVLSFLILFSLRKRFFTTTKEQSIFTVSPLIGNTGNLGIPLAIILFGEIGAVYTNAINLVNVFVVYTIGVFLYSRGNFSMKESIKNIFEIPIMWFAILAIILNLNGVTFNEPVNQALQMGAYASMTIQLVLFGVYLEGISLNNFSRKLLSLVSFNKFILLPTAGLLVIYILDLKGLEATILMLELMVPLALTNATLATLYDCKPKDVTANIVFTSLLFIPIGLTTAYLFLG